MLRTLGVAAAANLIFVASASQSRAFDFFDIVDGVVDNVADAAEDVREAVCQPPTREDPFVFFDPRICAAAMIADDVIGDVADPAPCGSAGQGTCLPILNQRRINEIGGVCERGLIEIPKIVCLRPPTAKEGIQTVEDIVGLIVELALAYQDFKTGQPLLFLSYLEAVREKDAERVVEILLEGQYFDEAFAIMKRLGMDTATASVSGGGFAVLGGFAEGGVAIDVDLVDFPQVYATRGSSYGVQLGVGIDVVLGAWVASNCEIDGKATGRGFQADAGPGVGSAIWFDDDGNFAGLTAAIGLVGAGIGVSKIIAETTVTQVQCNEPEQEDDEDPVIVVPPPGKIPEPKQITVAYGDTLWGLAATELGDPFRYPEIFEANRPLINDPDLIFAGQVLRLPE